MEEVRANEEGGDDDDDDLDHHPEEAASHTIYIHGGRTEAHDDNKERLSVFSEEPEGIDDIDDDDADDDGEAAGNDDLDGEADSRLGTHRRVSRTIERRTQKRATSVKAV